MLDSLLLKIILSVLLGAAIGLERESGNINNDKNSAGGIRTFSLISLLGTLTGIFYINNFLLLAGIITIIFFILIIIYYTLSSNTTKDFGLTSEISIIFTFLLGLLMAVGIIPMQIILVIFVILMLVLSLKSKTKIIVAGISRNEISAFISYAIIALVILPFLPNVGYTLSNIPFLSSFLQSLNFDLGKFANLELINPRKIWLVVVLVTGIDVFGYFLGRIVGNKKSFSLTSFVGGFVSSTSVTQSLAHKSKNTTAVNYLVGAALLANMASFFQLFLLIGPLNAKWLIAATPTILILIITSGFLSLFFLRKKDIEKDAPEKAEVSQTKIFALMPALKFACILIVVKIITKTCLILFGQSGFIISSVIASFVGLDAIILSLAEMAGGIITFKFALFTLILVNATNLLSKSFFSFLQGNRKFAFKFFSSVLLIITLSFAGLLLIK